MAGRLTLAERETGIIWDDQERVARVWSTSTLWCGKFEKLFGPGRSKGTFCKEWDVPLTVLRITRKRRIDSGAFSEARKEASRKALEKAREARRPTG